MMKNEEKSYTAEIDEKSQKIFSAVVTEHANKLGFYLMQLHDKERADLLIREAMADAFIKGTQFGFRTAAEAMGVNLKAVPK